MASSYLPRSIRRYRAHNPYAYAFLFNCLDVLVGLLKILALLLVLAAGWKMMLIWSDARSVDSMVKEDFEVAAVEESAPLKSPAALESANTSQLAGSGTILTQKTLAALPGEVVAAAEPFDEAWLMGLNASRFTVQLGTSPDLEKLVDFAREVVSAEQAHIFPFRVSSIGNPIYALVFGEHQDLQAAQQAVAQFPAAYREFSPWIRPVGQLQDQVRTTRIKLGL